MRTSPVDPFGRHDYRAGMRAITPTLRLSRHVLVRRRLRAAIRNRCQRPTATVAGRPSSRQDHFARSTSDQIPRPSPAVVADDRLAAGGDG